MSDDRPLIGALRSHLQTTLDTATVLSSHLKATSSALAHSHADAIERDLGTIAQLLHELERARAHQYSILRDNGYSPDAHGMRKAVEDSADPDLMRLWSTVRKELLHNREINLGNARLADASMRRTRRTLQLLSGNDTEESSAYGKQGTMVSPDAGHSIARA